MNYTKGAPPSVEKPKSFTCFEEIRAWQKARALTDTIYQMTQKNQHFSRDFELVRQLRRSAISTMSNIAEGLERDGSREFVNFLSIAKGSCGELRSQLYAALDQDYITHKEFREARTQAAEVSRLLNGLITYLRCSKFKEAQTEN